MNQYLTSNRYRRYPLVQDAVIAFSDEVLVDARFILSTQFNVFGDGNALRMTTIAVVAGTATLTFVIDSTELSGYKLTGTILTAASEDTRVLLSLSDSGDVAHPELGYGICFIGRPDLLGNYSFSATVDPSTIRLNVSNDTLRLRVANKFRPGPSTCTETEGAAEVLVLQGREAESVSSCVEVTTAPDPDQVAMDPDVTGTTTVEVAIVKPVTSHTRYANVAVTTITTHLATITDEIPAAPGGYDADVDGGVVPVTRRLTAGHNVKLNGDISEQTINLDYKLNAGTGVDCDDVLGYADLGVVGSDCLKSINGVHAPGGQFTLVAGTGIGLVPDQYGHRILVLVNVENLSRAAP